MDEDQHFLAPPTKRRLDLYEEFHRRAPISIKENTLCRHLVFACASGDHETPIKDLYNICASMGITPPALEDRQFLATFQGITLKWERHTEFFTFTLYGHSQPNNPLCFASDVTQKIERESYNTIEADLVAAVQVRFVNATSNSTSASDPPVGIFGKNAVFGGRVCDRHAEIWSDFHIYPDGYSRIIVNDLNLGPTRAGRLLQRLLDVETYRIIALLGLTEAHRTNAKVDIIERKLHNLLEDKNFHTADTPDRNLLAELLTLASQTEQTLSKSSFRFDATKAYARLVYRRFDELNEERIQGAQRLSNFLKRRFVPAVETCEAAHSRLHDLAARIHRDAALIRTRIDIVRQEQNTELLDSMNRRAQLQFKLQQTVEVISGIAISYYAIGIFAVFAKAFTETWRYVSASLLTAMAAPVIIVGVYVFMRKIRHLSEQPLEPKK